MKSYKQEHEIIRRRVWSDAWSATVNANDCKSHRTASMYADAALERFDELFKPLADETDFFAQHDELLAVLRLVRDQIKCGAAVMPQADYERMKAAIAKAEGGTP